MRLASQGTFPEAIHQAFHLPTNAITKSALAHPELLGRLPQGSENVEITGGPIHPINPIKAKIKLLAEGAVAARATALRNPKGLRRIDRALEELECVEDIQIANQGLAHNHSANRG
jgi:hypothetical protein